MAKGENTADHPGRQVGKHRFVPQPGSGNAVRDASGELIEVSDSDYDTWRTTRKEHTNRYGVLGGDG